MAITVFAVLLGATLGVTAARRGFETELHDALPAAHWIDQPSAPNAAFPMRIQQRFSSPTADAARERLSQEWILGGRTRDQMITVFRRSARTLYLIALPNQPAMLELVASGSCSAEAASFPIAAPDDWLQFGSDPETSLSALGLTDVSLAMRPCPEQGYWLRSPARGSAIFRLVGTTDFLSIGREPLGAQGAARQVTGLGLEDGRLVSTPSGDVLIWRKDDVWLAYQTARFGDAQWTACTTAWPALICDVVSGLSRP